ncbi:DEAD/DEAH box helicase, partial [Vibrio parahaemolyticus]
SLPMIQQLVDSGRTASRKTARALILAPTRELAEQIADNIKAYTKYTDLSVVAVFGGRKMSSQVSALENGVDILVATPGRLEEHIEQGNVSVANLEFLVFDEADRILDMGFIHAVRKIMLDVDTDPQIMMFSATTSSQLNLLAKDILRKPKRIEVERANTTAHTVA